MAVLWLQVFAIVFALHSAASAAESEPGDEILVSNKKTSVSRLEFEVEISRVPDSDRAEFLASGSRISNVIEDILLTKTLAAEARELGLEKTRLMQTRIRLVTDKLLSNARWDHLEKEIIVPDMTVRAQEVYKLSPERFTSKETVHALHILINIKGRSKEEALKRAEEVRALALAGKPFENLADEYSDDELSRAKKGDLGYISFDSVVKPFAEAAFALAAGEVSKPVETKFGFHVIKVLDKKPGELRSFDSVKDEIVRELMEKYIKDAVVSHRIAIRTDSDMKINEDAIQRLKTVLPAVGSSNKQ